MHEPEPRYFVGGGKVGVLDLGTYLRALIGLVLWLGLPAQCARLLGRRGARRVLHTFFRWWARRIVRHLRIRLDQHGLEHIQSNQRYVVVSLHEGFADVPALFHLPLNLRFVARDELFDWRFLGPVLRDTGQIRVTPEHGRSAYRQLRRAADLLQSTGESIVIFPQGTILGIETDFNGGAIALARALGWPLLPIALTGSHRVWEHPYTPRLRYWQRVSLQVLPAIPVAQLRAVSLEQTRIDVQRRVKAAALSGAPAQPRHFVPERDGWWDDYAYRIDPDFEELAERVAKRRAQ